MLELSTLSGLSGAQRSWLIHAVMLDAKQSPLSPWCCIAGKEQEPDLNGQV